ncbi:MAG: gluconokinase [Chloroflexi bacterium]|nr:gluconokinase [Chloroflexota bacterium]
MASKTAECVVGVDIGTTGARAVIFDLKGQQLSVTAANYPMHTPRPGWAEQDPAQVYDAAMQCLREAARWAREHGRRPVALGLSAILHSFVALDGDGNALTPSLIWADTRSAVESQEITRSTDALALYHRTGCPVHPMYPLAKLRWLRAHRPDVFERSAAFAGIKEYVLRRWTGLTICDRSVATGTGLYNLRAGDWDGEALALAGIDRDRLWSVVETTEPLPVPREALELAGLPADCVVVAGAGDGVLQTIGSGCVFPGQMVAMVATSGAIRAVVDQPQTDARGRTWCYYLAEGRWVAGAAINNAGIVYAWLRDQLNAAAQDVASARDRGATPPLPSWEGGPGGEGESRWEGRPEGEGSRPQAAIEAADLDRWAAQVPAGSNGLVFLPYLAGERSPNWNADARGLLFGLSLAHDYRHLARATLEGVAYRMRTIFEPMEEVAGPAREIRAAGGFVRSPLWLQIVADVLGRELYLVETPEASSLGAAQLAMLGARIATRFEDVARLVDTSGRVNPDPTHQATYSRLYDLYQELYERVTPQFATIAALQAELSKA